jgi:hypothetical protein
MEPGPATGEHHTAVTDVLEKGGTLVDRIEDCYKELGGGPKAITLRAAYSEFAASLVRYRDIVLKDCVVHVIQGREESKGVAKPAQWGNKDAWVKGRSSTGLASVTSGSTETQTLASIPQEFMDDDTPSQERAKQFGSCDGGVERGIIRSVA